MISPAAHPYDLTILQSNSNNDHNFVNEMIQIFKKNGDECIKKMTSNCIDGSSHDWTEAAHLLKGGAALIGAEQLRELCESAQNQDPSTASARTKVLETIKKSYNEIHLALQTDGFF